MHINPDERQALLRLARSTIEKSLGLCAAVERPMFESELFRKPLGCFVTLEAAGQLRGCIGNIEPHKPLLEAVMDNAISAAFHDPRFPSMTRKEWSDISIEISILTEPKPLEAASAPERLDKLLPGVHGVILSRGYRRATFLPQVWSQLPDKRTFLEHLCRKAGMEGRCWEDSQTQIDVYEAEHFHE